MYIKQFFGNNILCLHTYLMIWSLFIIMKDFIPKINTPALVSEFWTHTCADAESCVTLDLFQQIDQNYQVVERGLEWTNIQSIDTRYYRLLNHLWDTDSHCVEKKAHGGKNKNVTTSVKLDHFFPASLSARFASLLRGCAWAGRKMFMQDFTEKSHVLK